MNPLVEANTPQTQQPKLVEIEDRLRSLLLVQENQISHIFLKLDMIDSVDNLELVATTVADSDSFVDQIGSLLDTLEHYNSLLVISGDKMSDLV